MSENSEKFHPTHTFAEVMKTENTKLARKSSASDLTVFRTNSDGTIEYRQPAHPGIASLFNPEAVAISGSWREVPAIVEHDVIQYTRWLICSGHTLITGGALGVDRIATQEAIRLNADSHQLQVILPTPLDVYIEHYINAAVKNPALTDEVQCLITQLCYVKDVYILTEMDGTACNETTYYARNGMVIEKADRLGAFHVNGSQGVQDAINKALAREIPVYHRTYKTRPKPTEPVVIEE